LWDDSKFLNLPVAQDKPIGHSANGSSSNATPLQQTDTTQVDMVIDDEEPVPPPTDGPSFPPEATPTPGLSNPYSVLLSQSPYSAASPYETLDPSIYQQPILVSPPPEPGAQLVMVAQPSAQPPPIVLISPYAQQPIPENPYTTYPQ